MSVRKSSLAVLCIAGVVLSACAREPDPVTITPIYDKFGTASCPVGTVLVSTDTGAEFCQEV